MTKDFIYFHNLTESLKGLSDRPLTKSKEFISIFSSLSSNSPFNMISNICNSEPINLMECNEAKENILNKKSKKLFLQLQQSNVTTRLSDFSPLENMIEIKRETIIDFENLIESYLNFYI